MAKKIFGMPVIVALSTGDGNVVGPGSGGSTTDLEDNYWDYEMWVVIAADTDVYDLVDDGEEGSWADYVAWWKSHSDWDEDLFKSVNNGIGYDGP